jgi:predicted ATPase
VVDLEQERVLRGASVLPLTTREARLLRYLWQREGEDVTRRELLVEVWGYSVRARSRAVDATVQRLRTKIEHDPGTPDHLHTVWGSGYRLVAGERADPERPVLFGRDVELEALRHALADSRLVTVVGSSGVGKTRLARELAARVEHRFCALDTATDEAAVVGEIAAALGTDLHGAEVATRGDLLVLDNLEQVVVPAARVIAELMRRAPRLRILATSREALGLGTERVLELGPLDCEAAVALLAARAAAWNRDPVALRTLAVRLECMPLALELAAGLAPVLAPEAVLVRLDAYLDVLVSRRRDVPARHQSLRQAVAWSFDLLDDADARALVGLAVFSGGFTAEGAEGVLGPDAVAALGRLRARSLLRPLPGREHRLGLYEAVRVHALERFAGSPQLADARERHRAWYAAQARRRCDPAGPFPEPVHVAFVTDEIDNVLLAFDSSLDAHPEDAAALALAARHVFLRRGPIERARVLFDACLTRPLPDSLRGHVLRVRGTAALMLGRAGEAERDARAAVEAGAADALLQGRASSLLGMVHKHSDQLDLAIASFERAIALTREAGDRAYEATATGNYANVLWAAARCDDARRAYARSLELHREVGNERSAAIMLSNLGLCDLDDGRLERARFRLGHALAEHRRLGDCVQEGVTLGHLACHALVDGDSRLARERAEAGVRLLAGAGERDYRAHELLLLGMIAWEQGDASGARDALERTGDDLGPRPESLAARFLLDLVLRVDAGDDPEEPVVPAAGPERARALYRLADGFLRPSEAPEVLAQVPARRLHATVTPFRRELARRVR